MFKLAHLSDWHATSLDCVSPLDLANKRLLGWLSWLRNRRRVHRPEVLRALFKDLKRQSPDHVAVTGDLTNVSLPSEFEAAAAQLAELGPPEWISLVPGNHDAYVRVRPDRGWDLWAEYLISDDAVQGRPAAAPPLAPTRDEFPTVRVRGPVALVGVCSALPTLPGRATGSVGSAQLARLAATLAELGTRELCRVVLIHHPVTDAGFTPRRRLLDAAEFRRVLEDVGADLVLHGHGHRTQIHEIPSPSGAPIPVVGVRSSSHTADREQRRAHYHLFEIERTAAASEGPRFRFELTTRGYDAETDGFLPEGRRRLG